MYVLPGDSPPPSDISSWFRCDGWGRTLDKSVIIPHDIFVIGTQVQYMYMPPLYYYNTTQVMLTYNDFFEIHPFPKILLFVCYLI